MHTLKGTWEQRSAAWPFTQPKEVSEKQTLEDGLNFLKKLGVLYLVHGARKTTIVYKIFSLAGKGKTFSLVQLRGEKSYNEEPGGCNNS